MTIWSSSCAYITIDNGEIDSIFCEKSKLSHAFKCSEKVL